MQFRNTAILGVIFAALAAYFFLFESGKKQESAAGKVFDIEQDKITRVEVTTGGVTTISEKIPQQGWQIVKPIAFPADPAAVRDVLNEFASLIPARTVVDSAANLGEYGLDPPAAVVEVSAGLSRPRKLLIGAAAATGSFFFAANGDSSRKVFLITSASNSTLRKTTHDLRDRRLFHLDKDKIDRFTVRSDRNTLVCARDSLGDWRIKKPFRAPAEKNVAANLAGTIADLKALDFIEDDPTPAALRKYGLGWPRATAAITSRDGKVDATLSIGKTEDNMVYVKSSERNTIYGASPSRVSQILKTPEEVRRTTALDMKSYKVSRVDWRLGPEEVSVVKHAYEDWRMLKPVETRADDRTVNAFLDSLEVLKIRKFIPASPANLRRYGLDRPPVSVTCTLTERPFSQQLQIGKTSEDGRRIYVRDPGEDWIYSVNSTSLKNLPMTALDVRDRRVLRFKGYDVNVFEIVQGNKRFRVRRDEKEKTVWRIEEPVRKEGNSLSIGRAFSTLDTLRAEVFVSNDREENLARFGLDKPAMEINLILGGRGDTPEERLSLVVGKSFPGDKSMVYVKRRDEPEISLVKSNFMQTLKTMIQNTPTS